MPSTEQSANISETESQHGHRCLSSQIDPADKPRPDKYQMANNLGKSTSQDGTQQPWTHLWFHDLENGRNPLRNSRVLDLPVLAKAYPPLVPFLNSRDSDSASHSSKKRKRGSSIDFTIEGAHYQVAKSILSEYFSLPLWHLPNEYLVPTIPNRVDYLLAIDRLVQGKQKKAKGDNVVVLDIGTGASCIYPLLGVKLFDNYRFYASDNDQTALVIARRNIDSSHLKDRITLVSVDPEDTALLQSLFRAYEAEKTNPGAIQATMCNPPFYDVGEAAGKHPHRLESGSRKQSHVDGGELEFIWKMVLESTQYAWMCRWFTSLVAIKKDASKLKQRILGEVGAAKVLMFPLNTTDRTRRWILAWSFQTLESPVVLADEGHGKHVIQLDVGAMGMEFREIPKIHQLLCGVLAELRQSCPVLIHDTNECGILELKFKGEDMRIAISQESTCVFTLTMHSSAIKAESSVFVNSLLEILQQWISI